MVSYYVTRDLSTYFSFTGVEGEECPWDEDCNCQDQGYHAKCPAEVSVTITGSKKETSVFTKMGRESSH